MSTKTATTKLMSALVGVSLISTIGCDKTSSSFSLNSDSQSFKQSTSYVQRQMDILWVIDNSGSMSSSQTNIANNFNSFIQRFQTQGYDFHMAVTTTDAYFARYYATDKTKSRIRDGAGSTHSGVFVIDKDTTNLTQTFMTNVTQGTSGSGDERALSSLEEALINPWNSSFRRPGAFLSVIILSDEDDFSHNDSQSGTSSYYFTENYADPKMYPVSYYKTFLDNLTSSTDTLRNYSVNNISIQDTVCLNSLKTMSPSAKIGQRYNQLADLTGGSKISICGDFATGLKLISDSIIELASEFVLSREPVPASIKVTVNGVSIPQSATNGWTYNATNLSIQFHGAAVPPSGADVKIDFDPAKVII